MGILGRVHTGKEQLHWPSYGYTLGSRVREIRKIRGYSQEELADIVDMSRNSISNLERNENNNGKPGDPRLSTIYKISKALDVPPAALMPAVGEKPDFICVDESLPVDVRWPSKNEAVLFDTPLALPGSREVSPGDVGHVEPDPRKSVEKKKPRKGLPGG